ncbi:MAG TPA: CoA-binding protein [Planctomycetota bacterium]|nr:CoA-binding protein [Planctomycetota bacterium]
MPSVAVIGASTDRRKYGNKAVRAYLRQGWTVYPVHPHAPQIEGLRAYRSLREVPTPLDRVSLYLPPDTGLSILDDLAAVPHTELYVNPGAESPELIARAEALGLQPIQACSIVEIGVSPSSL